MDISLHALTLYARISPQWLWELRWLWTSIPWRVACELVSLIGLHTIILMQYQESESLLPDSHTMPKEFYNCILHQEALTALALTPMHILESAVSGKPVPHWPDSPWKSATITDLCQPYCRGDPAPAYKESDHISGPVVTSLSQWWWCQAGKRLLWVWLCFNSPLSSAHVVYGHSQVTLDITHFPMPLLLSGIFCLVNHCV